MQRTLSRIALAVGLLAGAIATPNAMADAPMVKTQAPGFYRVMVGDFEVTAISDGTVKLPMLKLMNNQPPEKIAEALKRGFLKEMVETSVNTYLINTGSKLVLVDTGAAGLFGPTLGNLLANLKAAGYQPEQVDEIYITHMHPDHVGMAGAESCPTCIRPICPLRARCSTRTPIPSGWWMWFTTVCWRSIRRHCV